MHAADETGLPSDDGFRQRLLDYLRWGSTIGRDVSQPRRHFQRPAGTGMGLGAVRDRSG